MTYCEAHPHVKQMYPCEECEAEYYIEAHAQEQAQKHYAHIEAEYYRECEEAYYAYLQTRLYRDKCLQWLKYTQYSTPLPDWYYYA